MRNYKKDLSHLVCKILSKNGVELTNISALDRLDNLIQIEKYHKDLVKSLKWYIENDDTNEGSEEAEIYNKFWLDGKRKAEKLIKEIEERKL